MSTLSRALKDTPADCSPSRRVVSKTTTGSVEFGPAIGTSVTSDIGSLLLAGGPVGACARTFPWMHETLSGQRGGRGFRVSIRRSRDLAIWA